MVRSSFFDMYPPLRLPNAADDTGCIEVCLGEESPTACMLAQDARTLAEEILRRVDELERMPNTRPQSS